MNQMVGSRRIMYPCLPRERATEEKEIGMMCQGHIKDGHIAHLNRFRLGIHRFKNTLRNHCEIIGPQTEPYLDLKNKFEQKYCFTLKTEYASEDDITNDINFIYNNVHIHTFTTGVDDPPICLPLNKMDMENDIFKMQSTGDTCIFKLTIGESKVSVNGKKSILVWP